MRFAGYSGTNCWQGFPVWLPSEHGRHFAQSFEIGFSHGNRQCFA
jgi:hypothetical protein